MKNRFAFSLITLLGVLISQSTAHATFHLMQIEQIIAGVNGDTTVQAIQLRMRAAGQNLVSGGKLVVFDAAGLNPITIVDPTTNVINGAVGDRVLIAGANFPSHTTPIAVPDFTMVNLIPASYFAAGSLCFESNSGTILWRLSWGGASYTGSNLGSIDNDPDGNFGPPFGSAMPTTCASALQFQGTATDFSSNNAADYLLIGSPIVFSNNARNNFSVVATLPTVSITATDPSASESPLDPGRFRIKRTSCTDTELTVFYTISGTATNGTDYRPLGDSATIRAGAPNISIMLRPIDDMIPEPDETAILTLSPGASYNIGSPTSATVTIHSNE